MAPEMSSLNHIWCGLLPLKAFTYLMQLIQAYRKEILTGGYGVTSCQRHSLVLWILVPTLPLTSSMTLGDHFCVLMLAYLHNIPKMHVVRITFKEKRYMKLLLKLDSTAQKPMNL